MGTGFGRRERMASLNTTTVISRQSRGLLRIRARSSSWVLIDSESRQVRLRTRAGADWLEQTLAEGETLTLSCGPVRMEMGLEEIYDRSGLEAIAPLG